MTKENPKKSFFYDLKLNSNHITVMKVMICLGTDPPSLGTHKLCNDTLSVSLAGYPTCNTAPCLDMFLLHSGLYSILLPLLVFVQK